MKRSFHPSTPSQTWARTRRGERIKSGRPACQAAKASTQTAAEVRPRRVPTADQPNTGGRCKWKKTRTRPKKRSLLARGPNSSAVQVGGHAVPPLLPLLPLRVPRDHGSCVQRRMNPGHQLEAPRAGVQTHYAWAQGQEPDGEFEQGAREGGIVDVGRRESKQQRQAGATTEQGMQPA